MIENIIHRADEVFTEDALKANDGKVVPLRSNPGGPVIGEATLKYDSDEKALKAVFTVDDPKVEKFFTELPPNIRTGE